MRESAILTAICQYLQYRENAGDLVFIRNNSFAGHIVRGNGSTGYVRNNKPGASDLIIFAKGKTIFAEVKNEKGKMSDYQKEFEQKVKALGHEYHIVRSVDEVERIVN